MTESKKYLKDALKNYSIFIKQYNDLYSESKKTVDYIDIDNIISPLFCDYYYDLCIFLNHQEVEYYHSQLKDEIQIDKWIYLPPIPSEKSIKRDLYSKYRISKFKTEYFDNRMNFFTEIKEKYISKYFDKNADNYFDTRKIKVLKIDSAGLITELFLLTSDVFGFTAAPSTIDKKININKYPLSRYKLLNKKSFSDTIYDLRKIGGAFLWPTNTLFDINCNYNKFSGVRTYLEDRVDLKLNEIIHYYIDFLEIYYNKHIKDSLCQGIFNTHLAFWLNSVNNKKVIFNNANFSINGLSFKNNELSNYYLCLDSYLKKYKNDIIISSILNSPMSIWLNHFKNAKNYIKYFKFEDFVELSNNKPVAISIINNIAIDIDNNIDYEGYCTKSIQNYLKCKKHTEDEKDEYIVKIVDNVKERIIKRSNRINKYL